jgi:hypothetical protein
MSRASHPLRAATLTLTRLPLADSGPPRVPPALAGTLKLRQDPACSPRLIGDVLAALDREGVLWLLRHGHRRGWQTPGQSFFDVAPDGSEAWVTCRRDSQVYTARLDGDAPDWQPIAVESRSRWGLHGVARLDPDHIVVKSEDALELIGRDGEGSWSTRHKVAVPTEATLRPFRGQDAILLCSRSRLLLYGRRGGRLYKLNTAKLQPKRRSALLPQVWFTSVGELWIDNGYIWRLSLSPPAPEPRPPR